jgi:hypothetical protein
MMWLSQIAYEIGKRPTIDYVSPMWGFTSVENFSSIRSAQLRASTLAEYSANDRTRSSSPSREPIPRCGRRRQPISTFGPSWTRDTDTHADFQAALDAARPEVERAIQRSQQAQKSLFITGHSLGGALAALAAKFASSNGATLSAIYVFGMPRAGGERFQTAHNTQLGR